MSAAREYLRNHNFSCVAGPRQCQSHCRWNHESKDFTYFQFHNSELPSPHVFALYKKASGNVLGSILVTISGSLLPFVALLSLSGPDKVLDYFDSFLVFSFSVDLELGRKLNERGREAQFNANWEDRAVP